MHLKFLEINEFQKSKKAFKIFRYAAYVLENFKF